MSFSHTMHTQKNCLLKHVSANLVILFKDAINEYFFLKLNHLKSYLFVECSFSHLYPPDKAASGEGLACAASKMSTAATMPHT